MQRDGSRAALKIARHGNSPQSSGADSEKVYQRYGNLVHNGEYQHLGWRGDAEKA